jgi:hypothetical protein
MDQETKNQLASAMATVNALATIKDVDDVRTTLHLATIAKDITNKKMNDLA